MKAALLVLTLCLGACAFTPETMLAGADEVPAGACLYNCFDWHAQSGGILSNASGSADGCVCAIVAGEGADCPRETNVKTPSGCEAGFLYVEDDPGE